MPRTLLLKYMGIGCLIALHWVCFYGAIKLANSSIALICAATVAFFTSMLEPLILRRKFDPVELLLGFLIIPGMYVIVQHVDVGYLYGIGVGLVASFLAAIFSILNKRYVTEASPYVINFVEMVSATLLVSFLIPLSGNILELGPLLPQRTLDWGYLLVLALVCTTFTNVITLKSLRHLTAFGSNTTEAQLLYQYCEQHSDSHSELLAALYRETQLKAMKPRMASGQLQGRILALISKLSRPTYIVEVGTYTGYATLCLAEGLASDGKLVSLTIYYGMARS